MKKQTERKYGVRMNFGIIKCDALRLMMFADHIQGTTELAFGYEVRTAQGELIKTERDLATYEGAHDAGFACVGSALVEYGA
jgi:hypothetical protein